MKVKRKADSNTVMFGDLSVGQVFWRRRGSREILSIKCREMYERGGHIAHNLLNLEGSDVGLHGYLTASQPVRGADGTFYEED